MQKSGSNRSFPYGARAAASGVALLLAAWSAPGLAAAHTAVGCDRTAEELKSLDVHTLRIEAVDLSEVSALPDDSGELTESVAPLLFLTPRVATILQDVFGDSDAAAETGGKAAAAAVVGPEQKPASSPLVDNAGAESKAEPVPSPMYEHAAILPRFQRQMYRTDI